jgi:hypothetical protein
MINISFYTALAIEWVLLFSSHIDFSCDLTSFSKTLRAIFSHTQARRFFFEPNFDLDQRVSRLNCHFLCSIDRLQTLVFELPISVQQFFPPFFQIYEHYRSLYRKCDSVYFAIASIVIQWHSHPRVYYLWPCLWCWLQTLSQAHWTPRFIFDSSLLQSRFIWLAKALLSISFSSDRYYYNK